MSDKKREQELQEALMKVKADATEAYRISQQLKACLSQTVDKEKLNLKILSTAIADFISDLALGTGETLLLNNLVKDLDFAVSGIIGQISGEAHSIAKNKYHLMLMKEMEQEKSSTSH